jgi:hypothetical protein
LAKDIKKYQEIKNLGNGNLYQYVKIMFKVYGKSGFKLFGHFKKVTQESFTRMIFQWNAEGRRKKEA